MTWVCKCLYVDQLSSFKSPNTFIESLKILWKKIITVLWFDRTPCDLRWSTRTAPYCCHLSVCPVYSLPKQWGRICHVAQGDFPEGSRCSFIKLSSRVEQRKGIGKRKKIEKKLKREQHRREERRQTRCRIRWMRRRRGWLSRAPHQTLP